MGGVVADTAQAVRMTSTERIPHARSGTCQICTLLTGFGGGHRRLPRQLPPSRIAHQRDGKHFRRTPRRTDFRIERGWAAHRGKRGMLPHRGRHLAHPCTLSSNPETNHEPSMLYGEYVCGYTFQMNGWSRQQAGSRVCLALSQ